jgi:hypothetical protein
MHLRKSASFVVATVRAFYSLCILSIGESRAIIPSLSLKPCAFEFAKVAVCITPSQNNSVEKKEPQNVGAAMHGVC